MASSDDKKQAINYKIPRPSSSIILVSPQNEVLLLHRVKTSSSFPSAHVFPGGNISSQDGDFPPAGHPDSHDDGAYYRKAAIREMFEESGILLAKNKSTGQLVKLSPTKREEGRHAIHKNEITFDQWLKRVDADAVADTEMLIPFSHWITPAINARRFTTQMYIYFLPPASDTTGDIANPGLSSEEVQAPTSDGGLEITEAQFLPASEWLRRAKMDEIIIFPPQVLLLSFVAQFLERAGEKIPIPAAESYERRKELIEFIHSGDPAWSHKFISPRPLGSMPDGRLIMDLNYPGQELEGTDKRGDPERVILVKFKKEGPRGVEVRWLSEVKPHLQDHKSSL
ncbi:NUDIX family hydrolase [Trichophyton tonsurans CBS 112818]|nr:NUDIX family hydrolase [Trichophyton tonsurans CBS 112818]